MLALTKATAMNIFSLTAYASTASSLNKQCLSREMADFWKWMLSYVLSLQSPRTLRQKRQKGRNTVLFPTSAIKKQMCRARETLCICCLGRVFWCLPLVHSYFHLRSHLLRSLILRRDVSESPWHKGGALQASPPTGTPSSCCGKVLSQLMRSHPLARTNWAFSVYQS